MSQPFNIIPATGPKVPIIISIPHCGIAFPDELKNDYLEDKVGDLDDTDWFLQDLNEFAADLGITVVHAHYHRWVIDLNRDPESAPLYDDGRVITGLCTTTDFLGQPIYNDGKTPNAAEVQRRLDTYYWPYYNAIQNLLDERIAEFGQVLLWDEHSIRSLVPSIRPTVFPQMILGNNDEKSAAKSLIVKTLENLRGTYEVNHNDPFKGGHITRYFGNPNKNIHALQLERNKNLYMDDTERMYHDERADKMKEVLKNNFLDLIQILKQQL